MHCHHSLCAFEGPLCFEGVFDTAVLKAEGEKSQTDSRELASLEYDM